MSRRQFPSNDPFNSLLVTPQTLHEALTAQQAHQSSSLARIVCLSSAFFLPNDPESRTGHSSFQKHRIPNSQYFNLDAVCDAKSPWPHMLPSRETFAEHMGLLGVRRDDSVVCFDTPEQGLFSAPRAAWTLTHFGHERVHVLNNFKLWVEQRLPVESGADVPADITKYTFDDAETRSLAVDLEYVQRAITANQSGAADKTAILDARSQGRWAGTAPEPRAGIPSGHMPTSVSVPFTDTLDPQTKAMLPKQKLRALFEERLPKGADAVISTCGTGVTAAVVDLAIEEAGLKGLRRRVYDGSWTEWASTLKGDERWITEK